MNLPYHDSAEKAVLSVLMHRYEGWDGHALDSEMFHMPNHKTIFEELSDQSGAVDITIFTESLMKKESLDALGGPAMITAVYMAAFNGRDMEENVKLLRSFSARRMAIINAHNTIALAESGSEGLLEILGEPITKIHERATSTNTEQNKSEVIKGVMEEFADFIGGKKTPMGMTVSLPTLTKAIRGFQTPRYAVLSAYPSGGKTLLAIQWLLDFAKDGHPALFVGMEMPTDQIIKRAICTASGIDPEALYDPLSYASRQEAAKPTKEHLNAIRKACRVIMDSPIHFEESIAPQLPELLTIIRRAKKRHKIKIVAIDYLQLIRDSSARGNREQEISNISHALQALAKELDLLIIVLSQQNQEGGTKYATTTTEDVDYHFSIDQVMDKESDDYKRVTGLWINKDRHTARSGFKIPMERDPVALLFREIPQYYTEN